jgi:hypothetical protein
VGTFLTSVDIKKVAVDAVTCAEHNGGFPSGECLLKPREESLCHTLRGLDGLAKIQNVHRRQIKPCMPRRISRSQDTCPGEATAESKRSALTESRRFRRLLDNGWAWQAQTSR